MPYELADAPEQVCDKTAARLVVALLLGLVLGAQTAAATECHRETPLPAEGAGASTQHDVGRWHITPDELFCRQWYVWDSRREGWSAVYREGEASEFSPEGRFVEEVYRGAPGNPEGY